MTRIAPNLEDERPSWPIGAPLGATKDSQRFSLRYVLIGLILAGIAVRLGVVFLGGNGMRTPWGGGGDTPSYVLLGQNLVSGRGYTYAGQPTAFRPPGYPILLAGFLKLTGAHALKAVRWFQFLEGLASALLCAGATNRIFGEKSSRACLVLALLSPTLVVTSGEILTEATATFLSAVFLYFLVRYLEDPGWITLSVMAATVGVATLVRFNMALCGFIVLWVAIFHSTNLPKWRGVAIAIFLPGLVLSPWLIRNWMAFGGAALFSTQAGFGAVSGVLIPQGRALPGDTDKIRNAVGWDLPGDLETDGPARDRLPSEPVINRRCWQAAISSWRERGWGLVPLTFKKLSYFWLSSDQLLWTGAFPRPQRAARSAGVFVYWGLLVFSVFGLSQLLTRNRAVAHVFLLYASVVTIAHVPFNMNTRYRIPFMDPWIAVLAGAGLVALADRVISNHKAMALPLNQASE